MFVRKAYINDHSDVVRLPCTVKDTTFDTLIGIQESMGFKSTSHVVASLIDTFGALLDAYPGLAQTICEKDKTKTEIVNDMHAYMEREYFTEEKVNEIFERLVESENVGLIFIKDA